MKKTPLYEKHNMLGGKFIDFGGWMMPVQYSGILDEHRSVRENAGLFDVSHMGEISVKGKGAKAYLQNLVTNDISEAVTGKAVYSPMCYPDGGVVDDLLIYVMSEDNYLVVVNASNTDKDYEWFKDNLSAGAEIENISESCGQLSIQGPKAQEILGRIAKTPLEDIKFYRFKKDVEVAGINSIVSRTGYTGEDGFEIYMPSGSAVKVWDALLEAGVNDGLKPAGLGARDTLRFEAALPLYGHELSDKISPLEAGLDKFVKLNKESFIGRDALLKQSESGSSRKLAGFEITGRGVARAGFEAVYNGKTIGFVTSGNFSPSLGKNLGLALVDSEFDFPGFNVVIRGKNVEAKTVPTPFYSKKYKK